MNFQKILKLLIEAPYTYDVRKNLEDIGNISMTTMKKDGYRFLGHISKIDADVYEITESEAILCGQEIEDEFYVGTRILCSERSLYIKKMQLSEKRKQVSMVNTNKNAVRQMFAKEAYTFVAKHFDLISDRVQYKGAKDLWQSISRDGVVNVYVFDEEIKDYLRDSNSKIIKYNSKNIDENEIWGKEDKHHSRLLVAVDRELK